MMNKKLIYLGLILAIFLVFGTGYIYKDMANKAEAPNFLDISGEDVIMIDEEKMADLSEGGSGEIEIAPGIFAELLEENVSTSTINGLDFSVLEKKPVFPDGFPAELKEKRTSDINLMVEKIRDNNSNFDAWIDLGIYFKSIDDYDSTRICFENASLVRPQSALPVSNLGNLYGYYLKDKVKAEKYYLQSLEIEPNVGFWYYQAFMFYREVMEDESTAKTIIEKGIANNPSDEELKNILNSLK